MNTISRRKNAASRLQTRDERNNFRFCENDRAMQRFSKNEVNIQRHNGVILSEVRKDIVEGSCKRFLSSLVWILSSMILAACDFHGPWEYYPEEREVYTGIYTYGYVMENRKAEICFSKVYELDESSAENFAFYDSAYVTLQGMFGRSFGDNVDTTIVLHGTNCFSHSGFTGIAGETYKLDAFFVWDSAGNKAKSRYKAEATIPNAVNIKGLNAPQKDGSYKWMPNKAYETKGTWGGYASFTVDFLEYPMDMEFFKCALDFDNTVGGVLSVLEYDMKTGESVKTTINKMLKGMAEADSTGYRGVSMHDPLESKQNFGFAENRWIAGFNNLATLYLMNMMLPLGEVYVNLYATDRAYEDYVRKVKASVSDSRVVPKSNIENGMGVFSGMAVSSIKINVLGEGVSMSHIAFHNCDYEGGADKESWETRGCRLYQDIACAGMSGERVDEYNNLMEANADAALMYRDSVYNRDVKTCYASNVKAAMTLDTTKWSLFLPDSMKENDKSEAYTEGLKRYCVASNFKSNHIADCSSLEKECLEGAEKNDCKEYLWEWCADRGWDLEWYGQCKSAFVSRYYIEELKSSILKREVEEICDDREAGLLEIRDDGTEVTKSVFRTQICENWCKVEDDQVKCQ